MRWNEWHTIQDRVDFMVGLSLVILASAFAILLLSVAAFIWFHL